LKTIRWKDGVVITVDQTLLPHRLVHLKLRTPNQIAKAIKNMKIRGAPLLGAAAALALAQTVYKSKAKSRASLLKELQKTAVLIKTTRPTAVNLFNSVDAVLKMAEEHPCSLKELRRYLIKKCLELIAEDAKVNRALSLHGAELIDTGDTVLTHCNAGELATVEYGTALGVIAAAHRRGKNIRVIATETRPLLQGARLTAYELKRKRIPFALITDNMVGYLMAQGIIDKVLVGADRILMSGHVINKIGTYTIAVLAKEHGIPFYVAAPTTTIDSENSVEEVVIEERNPKEVLELGGLRIAPKGIKTFNPAFDITPPHLVSALITEKGVIEVKPPKIRALLDASDGR
jgi:methylthioribose-1-phosphate isomerase